MISSYAGIESAVSPLLTFNPTAAEAVQHNVIDPLVRHFFAARDVRVYGAAEPVAGFSAADFSGPIALKMDAIYRLLFHDIHRGADGIVNSSVKYLFTLDADTCTELCSVTDARYSSITLGERVIGYVVLFPLPDVLAYLASDDYKNLIGRASGGDYV